MPPYPCPTCGGVHRVCACGRVRVICPPDEPGEPFAACEWCEAEEQQPETSATGCNGWRNPETWRVAWWLSRQPSTGALVQTCAAQAGSSGAPSGAEAVAAELARRLKAWIERSAPLTGHPALYADLLGAALAAVDYGEIAQHLLEARADAF